MSLTTLRRSDVVTGAVLVAFGGFVLFHSLQLDFYADDVPGPGFFPSLLGIGLAVTGVALTLVRLTTPRDSEEDIRLPSRQEAQRSLGLWAALLVASLAVGILGFPLTMLLLVAVILFVIERRRGVGTVITTIAIPLVIWLLFSLVLQVPLPNGLFGP